MRRKEDERLVAMEFESIVLTPLGKGESREKGLFAVEGVPGVFRRVARTPGEQRPDGHFLAFYGKTEVQLVRCADVERELAQAGFVRRPLSLDKSTPSGRREYLSSLFADAYTAGQEDSEGGEADETDAEQLRQWEANNVNFTLPPPILPPDFLDDPKPDATAAAPEDNPADEQPPTEEDYPPEFEAGGEGCAGIPAAFTVTEG